MSQVANATITAAEKAFSFVMDDKGYTEAVWLMTQLAIAAKKDDPYAHLRSVGISLPDDATLPDVTAGITDALDRAVDNSRRRSDLAEISGRALVGAVADALQPHLNGLFPNDKDTMRAALSKLGKQKEFGDLSRSFFDRLTNQSLQYFLSKTLATQVGDGMRFATMNQKAQFDHALDTHTREASVNAASDEMVRRHATAIRERTMPGDALLRTVHESASVISVPAVSPKEKQPDNFFRKRGGGWEARFNRGNTINIIGVDKGAEYINLLLAHPDREASVYEVVCGYALGVADQANSGLEHDDIEDGFQVTTGAPLSDAGVVMDRKAVEQYRAKYQSLVTEKAEAEEDGDHQRVEEIEDEMAQIADEITAGVGKGGKLRKAGDKRKNVRDAFRNAVNRAITAIGKYDKPLAEHLKVSIKHGNEVVYRPGMSIAWDVRPIVNE